MLHGQHAPAIDPSPRRYVVGGALGLGLLLGVSLIPGGLGTALGQTIPTLGPTTTTLSLSTSPLSTGSTEPTSGGTATLPFTNGQSISVQMNQATATNLPAGTQVQVVYNPAPIITTPQQSGSLGGGNTAPVSQPVDIKLNLVSTSGTPSTDTQSTTPTGSLSNQPVQVSLPVLSTPTGPGEQFTWLVEVQRDGVFVGYQRVDAEFDPQTNSLVFSLSLSQLQGTLFLPVIITPAYVENFLPDTHIYSGPFEDAVDFGPAGPQFTRFTVVAPQLGSRIYVFNEASHNYGWIEADSVGPVAAP